MGSISRSFANAQQDRPSIDEMRLIKLLQDGLPLVPRPYAAIARYLDMTESRVMEIIRDLIQKEYIKRYGVIVRHLETGYRANAMIVWDVPDAKLEIFSRQMKNFSFVTLCYRRPRILPAWPYNVYCMIHGHERSSVLGNLNDMIERSGWQDIPHEVLFSKRRFKQRGARYITETQ